MIAIVGGGPAGSTLALKLARLGHRVEIVERGRVRTDGESLNPGIWPLLDALGLRDAGGLRIHRSLVRWSSEDVVERHHRLPQLAVLRASFDAELRELARAAGATLSAEPLPSRSDDEPFVVDASGRSAWSRPNRIRTSEPMLAMRGTWRGAGLPSEARVEALADGWIWGSPMPDGTFAAIACADSDDGIGESRYFTMLRQSALFRDLRGECDVHCSDATTYAADDEDVLRVGDASHSLDPLSSSGVRSAMQSALHAAIVVNTMIRRPDDASLALDFYRQTRAAAIAEHREWTASFYAESRFSSEPFWRARSAASRTAAPHSSASHSAVSHSAASHSAASRSAGFQPAATPASLPAATRVTLASDLALAEIPCVVGDFIETRRGVTGPSIARPFVWLGNIEAASLLDPLAGRELPRETLLAQWRRFTPDPAPLLDRLLRTGVIDVCGG